MWQNSFMRLLVVEQESREANFLKRGLEEAGHVVDVADNGKEGEYLATLNPYDVLILDVMLSDIDGRQVCRDLRTRGIGTPTLLLSARGSAADKILGFNSGADQYLTKPFEFGELLARVSALGRMHQPPAIRPIRIADLEIDPLSRNVRRGNEEILLTAKEYQLLELLARHAGQIVLRTTIIEHVWDMHHDPTANSVDALVKHLRDKIDRQFEFKLIRTVRGVGYMIKRRPS
jgi:DNA-binding response OmpR family regulator